MKAAAACFAFVLGCLHAADYVPIAGGTLRTALPLDGETVPVAAFQMRSKPVTNAEFLRFVVANPEWLRGKAPTLYATNAYLSQWHSATDFAPQAPNAPVTQVSWFAASAYCASEGASLPSWTQWEFAAAADASRKDARSDLAWRAQILGWYEKPSVERLPEVGLHLANIYGIYDLHQLIWEWVDDFNGLFVTVDSRAQGEQKVLETCGAASLSLGDKENYAVLMRIALLAALNGQDSVGSLGFRCAKPAQ